MNRHNAPPVIYPSGRSTFEAVLLLLVWFLGLLTLLGWLMLSSGSIWRGLVVAVVLCFLGLAGFVGWRSTPNGQLAWDGQCWRWASSAYRTGSAEQSVSVLLDLQSRLFIRLENQAGARLWFWLKRQDAPERWLDLRRAVYSPHRGSQPLPDSELPSAKGLTA